MLQNSKITWLLTLISWFLASFSCLMHVVHCKQNGESFFFSVTPIYGRVWLDEYLTNWRPWQIDPRFSCKIARWWWGFFFQFQKKLRGGGGKGVTSVNSVGGGGGCAGPKKNLQVWDSQRLAPLILYMYFTQDWSSHICHSYIHWQENALAFLSPNIKTLKLHHYTITKLLMRPYHIDHGTDVQHKSVYKA